MYFYKYQKNYSISNIPLKDFIPVDENEIKEANNLFVLNKLDPAKSRKCFSVTDENFMFIQKEDLNIIEKPYPLNLNIPSWLKEKIKNKKVKSINVAYEDFMDAFICTERTKWNINVVGLGDVGSTLITGLRLIGHDVINKIGIYDLDSNKVNRMLFEGNQIYDAFSDKLMPVIEKINESDIFNCDMFVFCVTAGVPPVGISINDVRLVQYESNKKIISYYAKLARINHFKGIFAVVSDPVDQLCKAALLYSNINDNGICDNIGLSPEQIQGYGLGVMNARAIYYSKLNNLAPYYKDHGRAFGPHGDGLVIADNIYDYDDSISKELTEKAKTANIAVRDTGFKPYIAPALSSGALSIISTISGKWHYSSTFMGGAFIGVKNRLNNTGIEVEQIDLCDKLKTRLEDTYTSLCKFNYNVK